MQIPNCLISIKKIGQEAENKVSARVFNSRISPHIPKKINNNLIILKEIKDKERYAKDVLGIKATYRPGLLSSFIFNSGNFKNELISHNLAAEFLNYHLLDLKNAGYTLPNVISNSYIFRLYRKLGLIPEEYKAFFSDFFDKKSMFFDPATIAKIAGYPEDSYHELGHFSHCLENPDLYEASKQKSLTGEEKQLFYNDMLKIDKELSEEKIKNNFDYYSQNALEFVAYYFQKAIQGYKFSDEVSEMYQRFGGPKIRGIIHNESSFTKTEFEDLIDKCSKLRISG